VNNNTIDTLNSAMYISTESGLIALYAYTSGGGNSVSGNTVRNLTLSHGSSYASLSAIRYTGTTSLPAAEIQGNTVELVNKNGTNWFGGIYATGQYYYNACSANIGSITPNTIGGNTATNIQSLSTGAFHGIYAVLSAGNEVSNNVIKGISVGAGLNGAGYFGGIYIEGQSGGTPISIQNNRIKQINVTNTNTSVYFRGIDAYSNYYTLFNIGNVQANVIGDTAIANSIVNAGANSTIGINVNTNGSPTIIGNMAVAPDSVTASEGNYIANMSATGISNSTSAAIAGIVFTGYSSLDNVIGGNTIHHLQITSTRTGAPGSGLLNAQGIYYSGANSVGYAYISQNKVYAIASNPDNTSAQTHVAGIVLGSSARTHYVRQNQIFNLSNTSASAAEPSVSGLYLYMHQSYGDVRAENNMISLGAGQNTNTAFYGIRTIAPYYGNNSSVFGYFNSVQIMGQAPASSTWNSYGFYRGDNPGYGASYHMNTVLRNNIFNNTRTNASGGAGKHYAIVSDKTVPYSWSPYWAWDVDYNDLYTAAPPLARWAGTDANLLADWRTASNGDGSSQNLIADFVDPVNGDLHLTDNNCGINGKGGPVAGITLDFDNENRDTQFPDLGADEYFVPLGSELNGDYLVGTGYSLPVGFSSITEAVSYLNCYGVSGPVRFLLTDALYSPTKGLPAVNENYPITITMVKGGSSVNTVTFKPQTGVNALVTGNIPLHGMFVLEGADYIFFDGANTNGGTTKNLTFTNTSGSTSLFVLRNDAQNNIIKHSILKGRTSYVGGGLVVFGPSTLPGATNGNDNNLIHHCDLADDGSGAYSTGIYSAGTNGRDNNNNTISDNNIYNWVAAGIDISATGNNADGWVITGNHLYRTGVTGSSASLTGINFVPGNQSDNNQISGNYIGGSAPSAGGTYFTNTGIINQHASFVGINLNAGANAATSVQDNHVSNIELGTNYRSTFAGIFVGPGRYDIGNITGNVIGHPSDTSSILNKGGYNDAACYTVGIFIPNTNLSEVNVGAYTSTAVTPPTERTPFNVIANMKTISGRISGVESYGLGEVNINGNQIYKLTNTGSYYGSNVTAGTVNGVYVYGAAAGGEISQNIIHALLATYSTGSSYGTNIWGIHVNGIVAHNIRQNKIYNLRSNTLSTYSFSSIVGIYTNSNLDGSTSTEISNNMISLGHTYPPTVAAMRASIYGIWNNNTRNTNTGVSMYTANVYQNTVTIEGSNDNVAYNTPSFAYCRSDLSANSYLSIADYVTVNLKNNIFNNIRTGGTGGHYAISNDRSMYYNYVSNTGIGWPANASNYNNLYSYNPATLGRWGYSYQSLNFANWKTTASQDNNSINSQPSFYDSPNGDLRIFNTGCLPSNYGTDLSSIVPEDYYGTTRPATPDLGAFEYNHGPIGPLSGTYLVGAGNSLPTGFPSISVAIRTLICNGINGNVVLRLNDVEYPAENYPIVIPAIPGTNTYTVTIRPSTGVDPLINGYCSIALFHKSGANNIIFDGWDGAGALNRDLKIENIFPNAGRVFLFDAGTANSTVRNTVIQGSNTNTNYVYSGLISFTGTPAGHHNLVENNDISTSTGMQLHTAISTSGSLHSNNVIRDNNIYNWTDYGIYVYNNTAGPNWEISGNSFFYNRGNLTASNSPVGIYFSPAGSSHSNTIHGNYIGGTSPLGGTDAQPWVIGNSSIVAAKNITGIYLNVATTQTSYVTSNTIQNISLETAGGNSSLTGIWSAEGLVSIGVNSLGNAAGNLIGDSVSAYPGKWISISTGTGNGTLSGIWATNYTNAATISNNTISGFNTFNSGLVAHNFKGIYAYSSFYSSGNTYVRNNKVRSIILSSTGTSSFTGLDLAGTNGTTPTYHVLTITGNQIGSTTLDTSVTNKGSGAFYGINALTYVNGGVISNNNLSGLLLRTLGNQAVGINFSSPYAVGVTIAGNTLRKIRLFEQGALATPFYGILNAATGNIIIGGNTPADGNILTDLENRSPHNASLMQGIVTRGGVNTIKNNRITRLAGFAANANADHNMAVAGIVQTSTLSPQIIDNNTIYGLSSTTPTVPVTVGGIYYSGPTTGANNSIKKNLIHSFGTISSDTLSQQIGVSLVGGVTLLANNMIRLGLDTNGIATGTRSVITGIRAGTSPGGWDTTYIMYNSVLISGTAVSGAGKVNSYAFRKAVTGGRYDVRNNIFANERTGGLTGSKHYAVALNTVGGLTKFDYNIYLSQDKSYFSLSNGDTTLAIPSLQRFHFAFDTALVGRNYYNSAIAENIYSLNFKNTTTAALLDMHLNAQTGAADMGRTLAWKVTDDVDADLRMATPDIGADEGAFTSPIPADRDIWGPMITYTPLTQQVACAGSATTVLEAKITDTGSGVPTGGARMYYRRSAPGAPTPWVSVVGTMVSGTATNGQWEFAVDYSLVGGISPGLSTFDYYVVANDAGQNFVNPNIGFSHFDAESPIFTNNNIATPSVHPNLFATFDVDEKPTPDLAYGDPGLVCLPSTVNITDAGGLLTDNNSTTGTYTYVTGTPADVWAGTATAIPDPTQVGTPGRYYARKVTVDGCVDTVSIVIAITICPVTWIGVINSDWSIPGNWRPAVVPTANHDVYIPSTADLAVQVPLPGVDPAILPGVNGITHSIYFYTGANITITGGQMLEVKGDFEAQSTLNIQGEGTVRFSRTLPGQQRIFGSTTFPYLNSANPNSTLSIQSGMQTITRALQLSDGVLQGNGRITLASDALNTGLIDDFSSGYTGSVSGNITSNRHIAGTRGYRYLSNPINVSAGLTVMNFGPSVFGPTGVLYNPGVPMSPNNFPTCWVYNENDANAIESTHPQWGWVSATTAATQLEVMRGYAVIISGTQTLSYTGPPNTGNFNRGITYTVSGAPTVDGSNFMGNPYPSPISWNAVVALPGNAGQITNIVKRFANTTTYTGQYADWNGVVGTNGANDNIALGQGFFVQSTPGGTSMVLENSVRRSVPGAGFFEETPPAVPNSLLRLKITGTKGADEAVVYVDANASDGYDMNLDAPKLLGTEPGTPNLFTRTDNARLSINAIGELDMDKEIPLDVVVADNGQHTLEIMELANFSLAAQVYLEDRAKGQFYNLRNVSSLPLDVQEGLTSGRFFLHLRNASSSLNDAIASQALHLYPNPVSEVLSLGWKQEGRELPELVEIHDATGRLIMRRNASELNTGSTITVSVKDLASGTYQVTLTTNKNRYTRAFVVAH